MKKVKSILIVFLLIIGLIMAIGANQVYALDRTLRATFDRPYSDDDGNGIVGDDHYEVQRAALQKIFKIYQQYPTTLETLEYPDAIYCLRASIGFGSNSHVESNVVTYTVIGDMRVDAAAVRSNYTTITGINISNQNYNSILWILDQIYLPRHKAAGEAVNSAKSIAERAEMKAKLLTAAGISPSTTSLTDDDIEVIQQMAIWYFSNYDQNGQANSLSLPLSENLSAALRIKGNPVTGAARLMQIQTLYRYLVDEGTVNNTGAVQVPPTLSFASTNPKIREKTVPPGVQYYVVGPFEITKTGGNDYGFDCEIGYKTLTGIPQTTVIDNVTSTVYISDVNGTKVAGNKQIKDMVGQGQFYIALRAAGLYSNLQELKLSVNYSYWETSKLEYLAAGAGEQPVVLVEKNKVSRDISILAEPITGEFNLQIEKRAGTVTGSLITESSATFTVTRTAPTAGAAKQYQTFDLGRASLDKETITASGQIFRYSITESIAPTGYNGYVGTMYVAVETGISRRFICGNRCILNK